MSLLSPLTWVQILKHLESPIACSNDFQVAIMFPAQGHGLYQLLMDCPQEENVKEVRAAPPGFVVGSFTVQRPLPRLGATRDMTEWQLWHPTPVQWLLALLGAERKLG